MSTPRTVVSALRPSAAMRNRAAHACAASYRQRQRVPSLLSAPSEYMQHSGSRSRLQQASHSWSTPQDTQHKRKLWLPQRTRRTALAFSCKLRPPRGTALPKSCLALFPVCPVANALPSRGRRRKSRYVSKPPSLRQHAACDSYIKIRASYAGALARLFEISVSQLHNSIPCTGPQ